MILRLRHDEWHDAGRWRAILLGAVPDPREDHTIRWDPEFLSWLDHHDEAKVGDVWAFRTKPSGPNVVTSYHDVTADGLRSHWPVTHFGLVCPIETCHEGVHVWHHAYNCKARDTFGADCKRGKGRGSCWDWSGSIESNDLSANPSLEIKTEIDGRRLNTCGFHGHLKAGVLS